GRCRRRIWPRSIGSPCKARCCRGQPSPPTMAMESHPFPLTSACARRRALRPSVLSGLGGEGRDSTRPAFAAAQISSEVCKVCPSGRFVARLGVEVGITPFVHPLGGKMAGARDRLKKGLIPGRPADIRRGTAALGTDEAGIIDAGRRHL